MMGAFDSIKYLLQGKGNSPGPSPWGDISVGQTLIGALVPKGGSIMYR